MDGGERGLDLHLRLIIWSLSLEIVESRYLACQSQAVCNLREWLPSRQHNSTVHSESQGETCNLDILKPNLRFPVHMKLRPVRRQRWLIGRKFRAGPLLSLFHLSFLAYA
jgi:hypothetical protein